MKEELPRLYQSRFDDDELAAKDLIWKVLCKSFFQGHVDPSARVLDLGAGACEFINNIDAAERHAVDLNPDTKRRAATGVMVHLVEASELPLGDGSIDVVFTSNFFEHTKSKDHLMSIFKEIKRVLVPGGQLLVLMPNFRYSYDVYWDFWDHHLPLSDRSLAEGLEAAGFSIVSVIPRFLPYSTKSRLPRAPLLVNAYLNFKPAWRILGKQMFIIASKPASNRS